MKIGSSFEVLFSEARAHSRIIYDCAWLPTAVPKFVTVSRDKSIRVWEIYDDGVRRICEEACADSVTAVACQKQESQVLVAISLNNGKVHLYEWDDSSNRLRMQADELIDTMSETLRLAFHPTLPQLAVGGRDGMLRVVEIT